MGKGRRYELDLKNTINENTREWVKAHRPDYSGSSAGEVADLMVVWQKERYSPQRPCGHSERKVAYIELKKRQADDGKRATVMAGRDDENGNDELQELIHESPSWADTWFAVKFDHRALAVVDAEWLRWYVNNQDEAFGDFDVDDIEMGVVEALSPRLTPGGNVSMTKPSLDSWQSSTAGEPDWRKLATSIGLEPYDFEEGE